jgi:hypothetical protein
VADSICRASEVGHEGKVTDEQINGLSIKKEKFHGEWNYTILPQANIG